MALQQEEREDTGHRVRQCSRYRGVQKGSEDQVQVCAWGGGGCSHLLPAHSREHASAYELGSLLHTSRPCGLCPPFTSPIISAQSPSFHPSPSSQHALSLLTMLAFPSSLCLSYHPSAVWTPLVWLPPTVSSPPAFTPAAETL